MTVNKGVLVNISHRNQVIPVKVMLFRYSGKASKWILKGGNISSPFCFIPALRRSDFD